MRRETRVTVRLSAAEAERLDVLALGRGRAATLRELLRADTPRATASAPTAAEALELLTESARDGSVPARVALARLLSEQNAPARTPTQARRDELRARREAKRGPA